MSERQSCRQTLWRAAIFVAAGLATADCSRAEAAAVEEYLQRIEISSGWKIKSFGPCEELDCVVAGRSGTGGARRRLVGRGAHAGHGA